MTPEQAAALREPFPPATIGKLPRKTKTGGTVYLDYVGHAAVTDRLLQVDPEWSWEPVAFDVSGLPAVIEEGPRRLLWIRLTVCGMTRLGVGIVSGQKDEVEKELISDAIRNAAMRFGVALDLWAKEDLHAEPPREPDPPADDTVKAAITARIEALDDNQRTALSDAWRTAIGVKVADLTVPLADAALRLLDARFPEPGSEPEDGATESCIDEDDAKEYEAVIAAWLRDVVAASDSEDADAVGTEVKALSWQKVDATLREYDVDPDGLTIDTRRMLLTGLLLGADPDPDALPEKKVG